MKDKCALSMLVLLLPSVFAADMTYVSDSYTTYGGVDGIVWEGGSLTFKCDDCAAPDMACYDYEYDSSNEECWARSDSALTNCKNADYLINTFCNNNPSLCHSSGITSTHSYPSGLLNSKMHRKLLQRTYEQCSGATFSDNTQKHVYSIDRLNTSCSGSSSWVVSGRWDTSKWRDIQTISCPEGYVCNSTVAGYVSASSTYNYQISDGGVHYPCAAISNSSAADLAIVDIIPIQVMPGVDMIKDKSGYVVVNVTNLQNGGVALANVTAWFNGEELLFAGNIFSSFNNTNPRNVAYGDSQLFVFVFKPSVAGTNIVVNASVEAIE